MMPESRFCPRLPFRVSPAAALVGLLIASSLTFTPALAQVAAPEPATSELPGTAEKSALDAELFYQVLLAELNVTGGDATAAFPLILDAARRTQDAKLYERAVKIALSGRAGDVALRASQDWLKAIPTSRDANRYVLQLLIGLNRMPEAVEPIKRDVALADPKERGSALLELPRYFGRAGDKKQAAATLERALAEYLTSPTLGATAWTTVGRLRAESGDASGILEAARKGQAIDARNDGPALLALTLMSSKVPQAEPIVRTYLDAPASDNRAQAEVRMSYARILLDAQRYSEASTQVQIITKSEPDFAQAWLIQGTLEQQDRKSDAAENSLKRYVQLTTQAGPNPDASRGLAQAYLSLAQMAEQKKDFSQAEGWLAKIGNTQDMISAQSLRAGMLAKQGKLQEGLKLVRDIPERNAADSRMKILVEVQLLRDNKQYKTAYDFLADKTKSDPPDFDLLYDQAMLADKLGQPSEMERLLRQVMAGKPGFHHAYNALGYSLADRNVRLPEARQMILKALEFAPDDPFISDSLGWVEFRSGNTTEAIRILQTAYQARPDAEIGAHLGEVLWASGKRQQAMTIWREAKALNPDNETLLETLKRLRVKL